ncbi:MAG TPA: FAD-binding oxidoreductase [Rubrobacteraceae bacterium]|nr:FAD-binding oxidoreductase [Rubrobacteraceae bacterium]
MTQKPHTPTSHEDVSHDSLDGLGYDWSWVANPDTKPLYPFKVYLPQTTQDVVEVVEEVKRLGQELRIRSRGHSSNDLVLTDGAILLTDKLDQLIELNEAGETVTVQAGFVLARLDKYLGERGYGLPVIGDHSDITAGGFASVGGFSPASLSYGMFVDNIAALEYVNWDGELIRCSNTENRDEFYRVITGTGQYGVIVTLTLNIMSIDKEQTILGLRRTFYKNLDDFIEATRRFVRDPPPPADALMERIQWIDFPTPVGNITFGQLSTYKETSQTGWKALRNTVEFGYLHGLGRWAGQLPDKIDQLVKILGTAGVMLAPRYSSVKNVETLTDKVLDASVGDPTRWLAVISPVDEYEIIFRELYRLCLEYRNRHEALTLIALYVKALRSEYLDNLVPGKRFCELLLYLNVNTRAMTEELTESLVSRIDDLCIEHGAFRYMHTKTVKDPQRRRLIDPNAAYNREASAVHDPKEVQA